MGRKKTRGLWEPDRGRQTEEPEEDWRQAAYLATKADAPLHVGKESPPRKETKAQNQQRRMCRGPRKEPTRHQPPTYNSRQATSNDTRHSRLNFERPGPWMYCKAPRLPGSHAQSGKETVIAKVLGCSGVHFEHSGYPRRPARQGVKEQQAMAFQAVGRSHSREVRPLKTLTCAAKRRTSSTSGRGKQTAASELTPGPRIP